MSQATPTRRRWYQFSIGTMLLLVTVFAVWLGWELSYIRERKAAMATVERAGGTALPLAVLQQRAAESGRVTIHLSERSHFSYVAHESLHLPSVPFWRRWLGDEPICLVAVRSSTAQDDAPLKSLFPEAQVTVLDAELEAMNVTSPMPKAPPAPIK